MSFNSLAFAAFAVIVGLGYFLAQTRGWWRVQNWLLLIASYFFYGAWDHRFLFLILLSTAVDFACGQAIASKRLTLRQGSLLLGILLIASVGLCVPINWEGLFSSALPNATIDGGWVDFAQTPGMFAPGGDWRAAWAAVIIVMLLPLFYGIGWRIAERSRAKYFLIASIASNLTLLGFFKYFDFFVDSAARALASVGWPTNDVTIGIIVPVGISFYTFQTMSYTIDVYRQKLKPTDNLRDFALFVAFFPQLVAGPIERAKVLLPQLSSPRQPDWQSFQVGAYLVIWGLFKKIFIADNLAIIVTEAYDPVRQPSGPQLVVATWAFAWQIYCDFSAYSDIARGLSRMMGIELMVNFNVPYAATNPKDFWRRWHISLSTWLRDYLYISLGGNRGGNALLYRNLMLTMILGGLWHGARMNFVWWGLYQGVLLCGHRVIEPHIQRFVPRSKFARHLWNVVMWVGFFQLVCYGWLLFRAESNAQVANLTGALFHGWHQPEIAFGSLAKLIWFISPLVLVQLAQVKQNNLLAPLTWPLPIRVVFYLLILYLMVIFGAVDAVEFIYFQF